MQDYLFIDQDIEKLREDILTSKRFLFRRLVDQCERYKACHVPAEHPKSSSTFMGMAIANLSLAWLLTYQKHYLKELQRWIKAVVGYPHWGHAHLVDVDLSAAWLLFGLSIAYDWNKGDFESDLKDAVQDKLILQAERMYDYKIETEGQGWSTNYWQNHNWINMTGLAACGYALKEDYPHAQKWIDAAKENFAFVYDNLSPDGSNYEGVVYWRYGAMWLFVYAHLLKEREGINYFKHCEHLKNTFWYRLYQAAPNLEEQVNFGDCHDRRSGHSTAIYYKTAAEYRNPYAQKLANLVVKDFLYREAYESKVKPGILPECFFELLFYDETVQEKDFSDLPLSKYFPDLGLIVIRDSWKKDAMHFSFKCSVPGGHTQWDKLWELKNKKNYNSFGLSHQHPDNNSFILIDKNTYLAIDDGYNREVRAGDHNTVIVDGEGYTDEGQNNVWRKTAQNDIAEIKVFTEAEDYVFMLGESSANYKKELDLKSFERAVFFNKDKYFVIFDRLKSDKSHYYTWILNADVYPDQNQDCFTYCNGSGKLTLNNLTHVPCRSEMTQNTIEAVMTTQEPDKKTTNPMKVLSFTNQEKKKNMLFCTVLQSQQINETPLAAHRVVSENASGAEIISDRFTDYLLYSDSGNISFKGKRFKAKLLFLRFTHDGCVREVNLL